MWKSFGYLDPLQHIQRFRFGAGEQRNSAAHYRFPDNGRHRHVLLIAAPRIHATRAIAIERVRL